MKTILVFLFLIAVLSNATLAKSLSFSALADGLCANIATDKNANTSSPLMILSFFGFPETKKPPAPESNPKLSRTNDENSSATDKSTEEENVSADWQEVDFNPESQADQLQRLILSGDIALKAELTNENLLQAREAAKTLHLQAQEKLKQINSNSNSSLIKLAEKKAASLEAICDEAVSKLPQRNIILESGGQGNKVQPLISQAELSGKAIITDLQSRLTKSEKPQEKETIAQQIITTAQLVQELQQLMLSCHTPFYITVAKDELDSLHDKIPPNPGMQELKTFLDNTRTRYLFAEAEHRKVTLATVNNIIKELESETEKLERAIAKGPLLLSCVTPENKEKFQTELDQKETIRSSLQRAMLIYSQIENELIIETEAGSLADLKDSIEKKFKVLEKIPNIQDITLKINGSNQSALTQLKTILANPEFPIANRTTAPQDPLNFLATIQSLESSHSNVMINNAIITGENGKIILSPVEATAASSKEIQSSQESSTPSNQERKKWTDGINLIRFALARKYGMQSVGLFDTHFSAERAFNLGLSLEAFKSFLQEKISITSSHFLSPLTPIDKFITRLDIAPQDATLKWSEAVAEFNPFLPTSVTTSQEELATINKEELVAAIAHGKRAVEKMLGTFSITPNRTNAVIKRYNNQFNQRTSLTVGELRTFIDTEQEKIKLSPTDFWEDHMTDSIRNGLISGIASGTASVAIALFAHHLLALNIYCFLTGTAVGFIISHIILPALL